MPWMDCFANFWPLQPDFKCVKLCYGKTVDLGPVFHPFGNLIGALGVTTGGTWSPGMWMRLENVVDGLSGQFWAATF